jgi:hypothetical protein
MKTAVVVPLGVIGILVVGGALLMSGVIPLSQGEDSARPPCDQLPSVQAVNDAVASHQELIARIEKVGQGVKVGVGKPCGGQTDRAIVHIEYAAAAERKDVDAILQNDSFGVPVELVKN